MPVRKKGKLPGPTYSETYDLEYGTATVEVHVDAFRAGDRVLIIDDVLATGGTAAATAQLIRRCDAEVVSLDVLIELGFLGGRARLTDLDIRPLLRDLGRWSRNRCILPERPGRPDTSAYPARIHWVLQLTRGAAVAGDVATAKMAESGVTQEAAGHSTEDQDLPAADNGVTPAVGTPAANQRRGARGPGRS